MLRDTSTICMEDLVVIMSSLWYKHSSTLASLSSQSQINSHALYYKTKQNKNKPKTDIQHVARGIPRGYYRNFGFVQ